MTPRGGLRGVNVLESIPAFPEQYLLCSMRTMGPLRFPKSSGHSPWTLFLVYVNKNMVSTPVHIICNKNSSVSFEQDFMSLGPKDFGPITTSKTYVKIFRLNHPVEKGSVQIPIVVKLSYL